MKPIEIIHYSMIDGINFEVTAPGTIKVTGEQTALTQWLPIIRSNKPDIIAALSNRNTPDFRKSYLLCFIEKCSSDLDIPAETVLDSLLPIVDEENIINGVISIPTMQYLLRTWIAQGKPRWSGKVNIKKEITNGLF
jgi:hypothetical protein